MRDKFSVYQIRLEAKIFAIPELKTQASFFYFPQKFFGNVAGIPRKNFVSMGVQGCLLFVISAMILVALQKQ